MPLLPLAASGLIGDLKLLAAIPGEAPRSGACGGIQLLGLEVTQVRQKWRLFAARSAIELAEDAGIFTSKAAPNASFKQFSADVERNVAEGHQKIARCCEENRLKELSPDGVMRSWELASP